MVGVRGTRGNEEKVESSEERRLLVFRVLGTGCWVKGMGRWYSTLHRVTSIALDEIGW